MDRKKLVRLALKEDLGKGDITSASVIAPGSKCLARIISKDSGILCGLNIAKEVFKQLDRSIRFAARMKSGQKLTKGKLIAEVSGPTSKILSGERLALNFLQRLSGIAALASLYKKELKGTKATLLDTRKTTPLLRELEKEAVAAGGGTNHRMGLYDSILIKDNHLPFIKDLKSAVAKAKNFGKVEIEAKTLSEVKSCLSSGADRILLDNMGLPILKKAVKLVKEWNRKSKRAVKTEASGGITLKNIRLVAKTGVDFISAGALTHSPRSLDICLKISKRR